MRVSVNRCESLHAVLTKHLMEHRVARDAIPNMPWATTFV